MTPLEIIAAQIVHEETQEKNWDYDPRPESVAQRMLAALSVGGFVVAPKEPTREMMQACLDLDYRYAHGIGSWAAPAEWWKAMINKVET